MQIPVCLGEELFAQMNARNLLIDNGNKSDKGCHQLREEGKENVEGKSLN